MYQLGKFSYQLGELPLPSINPILSAIVWKLSLLLVATPLLVMAVAINSFPLRNSPFSDFKFSATV